MYLTNMKIHLYSPKYYEKWTHSTPDITGIGGSETAHIETAIRLAKRGFDVYSYSPLPEKQENKWGVKWLDLSDADFENDGTWLLYRCPQVAEKIRGRSIVICQDVDYPGEFTEEAISGDTIFLALCTDHYHYLLNKYPTLNGKLLISSNGIKSEYIDLRHSIERNPKRIMYASSPDRGLLNLVKIFKRALEFDGELKLFICYGFDNFKKTCEKNPYNRKMLYEFVKAIDHPAITHLGRLPTISLYQEWLKSGLWVYPTNFTETNCITSMEAQALGAIPICSDVWALKDKVRFGTMISGDCDDRLTQARYVMEILKNTTSLDSYPFDIDSTIRQPMMEYARKSYGWDYHVIDGLVELIQNVK